MAFDGLHIAKSGVMASQRALDVTGHNIANVGTPGHTRQRVDQASTERPGASLLLGPGANGSGVTITGVERIRDLLVDASLRSELASTAGFEATAAALSHIEAALGPLHGGLSDDLSAFWNSWEELSLDPESMTARQLVVEAGDRLARTIRSTAAAVDAAVTATRGEADLVVVEQNTTIAEVARLNGEIADQQASGHEPHSLLDQRDLLLDRLAEGLGATVHVTNDGDLHVSVGGYAVVRGKRFSQLSITGTPPTLTSSEGGTVNASGRLGALLTGASAAAAQVQADLDALASTLRDDVNDQHRLGFDLAGAGGIDYFAATGAADIALAAGLDVTTIAASADGASADGNNALALAAVRNLAGPSGTLDETARSIIGRVGGATQAAQQRAEIGATALEGLRDLRSSTSGVNLDEELTMLLQYQRAYEASARVMTSVDEMLDVLINRTGLVGR